VRLGKTKKGQTALNVEVSAMKAYSLAIAQAAENNEPDEPITYSTGQTDEEKDLQRTKDFADKLASDDGDDAIVN